MRVSIRGDTMLLEGRKFRWYKVDGLKGTFEEDATWFHKFKETL